MRKNLAWSFVFLFAGVVACGGVTANGDGGAGAGGTHATGGAGSSGSAGAGTAGAGSTGSAGAGAAGSGAAGAAGHGAGGSTGSAGVGAAGHGAGGATGMAGGGGAGHGAAGTGGGTGGAGGATGGKPCVDVACAGACEGNSCGGTWTCDTQVACSALATQYCGCDGKTFTGSSCAQRAFAFVGTCEAGVSCDTSKVLCKIASPVCPAGQVVSVNGSCYGHCVPVEMCACSKPADCPNPDTTTCHMNTMRCGPFVN